MEQASYQNTPISSNKLAGLPEIQSNHKLGDHRLPTAVCGFEVVDEG